MTASPTDKRSQTVPWGKKYRNPLMNAAFWAFWLAFRWPISAGRRKQPVYQRRLSSCLPWPAWCRLVTKK